MHSTGSRLNQQAEPDAQASAAQFDRPDEQDPLAAVPGGGPALPAARVESPHGRSRRHALRGRLYAYALIAVALSAAVVALAASNTAKAKVSWVLGSSHVSLVWMILATAVLGWLLGLLTAAALHRRTRAPR
jgi:uncharacterized integral membrane protein